jgi:hypothetical protein
MIRALMMFISAVLGFATLAQAQNVGQLYSRAELEAARASMATNLRGLWEGDFLTRLTPDERRRAGTVTLNLPLVGRPGQPLDFFADPAARQVFMPITSVKFLDDVHVAIAYHERRGCGMGAISDYMGVLRARPAELAGTPRQSLGVPPRVLEDPFVDDVSQKMTKSTIYFIAAHEYAHVMYGHAGYRSITAQQAQRQEAQADAFAMEVMRRIAVPPLGLAHFFMLMSRLEYSPADFPSTEQYEAYLQQQATHPLSSQRILALADTLQANAASYVRTQSASGDWVRRVMATARDLRIVGQTLDNRDMRRFLAQRSRTVAVASLGAACKP